jgi:hypothetical protein
MKGYLFIVSIEKLFFPMISAQSQLYSNNFVFDEYYYEYIYYYYDEYYSILFNILFCFDEYSILFLFLGTITYRTSGIHHSRIAEVSSWHFPEYFGGRW